MIENPALVGFSFFTSVSNDEVFSKKYFKI